MLNNHNDVQNVLIKDIGENISKFFSNTSNSSKLKEALDKFIHSLDTFLL